MTARLRGGALLAANLALVATASAQPSNDLPRERARQIVGEWSTSFGRLRIQSDVTPDGGTRLLGRYDHAGGRLADVRLTADGTLSGYWIQRTGSQRQATARDGSHHWGRFRFRFVGDRLDGSWSYGDAEPSDPWEGTRRDEGAIREEVLAAHPAWLRHLNPRFHEDWEDTNHHTYATDRLRVVHQRGYVHRAGRALQVDTYRVEQQTYDLRWGEVALRWAAPNDAQLFTLETALSAEHLVEVARRVNAYQDPSLVKESVKALAPFLGAGWDALDNGELIRRISALEDDAARLRAEIDEFRGRRSRPAAMRYVPLERGQRGADQWTVLQTVRRERPVASIPSGTIQITARGEEYRGWPRMRVIVDGAVLGDVNVANARSQTFRFTVSSFPPRRLQVIYLNDAYAGSPERDRNLIVEEVRLDGEELPFSSAIYQRWTEGTIPGQGLMKWAGQLLYTLPASDGARALRTRERLHHPTGELAEALHALLTRPDLGRDPYGTPLRSPRSEPADEQALLPLLERVLAGS